MADRAKAFAVPPVFTRLPPRLIAPSRGKRLPLKFCSGERLTGEYRGFPAAVFQPEDPPLCARMIVASLPFNACMPPL